MSRFGSVVALLWALLAAAAPAEEALLFLEQPAYAVPAILHRPTAPAATPAVLLLHGTASQKDEVGGLYRQLAAALAARGIASLRIDFAGTGDSPVDYAQYTLSSAVRDARTALAFLRAHEGIDASRMAVLGFSQGGLIAQRVVLAEPSLRALATWSTAASDGADAFADFFDRYYAQARENGYAVVAFDWLPEPLRFSHTWFEELREQRTLSDMRGYKGPILAVAGLADHTVPFGQSVALVGQSAHPDSRAVLLAGADHIFNVLAPTSGGPGRASHEQLIDVTVSWLNRQLTPAGDQSPAPRE